MLFKNFIFSIILAAIIPVALWAQENQEQAVAEPQAQVQNEQVVPVVQAPVTEVPVEEAATVDPAKLSAAEKKKAERKARRIEFMKAHPEILKRMNENAMRRRQRDLQNPDIERKAVEQWKEQLQLDNTTNEPQEKQ